MPTRSSAPRLAASAGAPVPVVHAVHAVPAFGQPAAQASPTSDAAATRRAVSGPDRAVAHAVPHGGDLRAAAQRFGVPRERWLDLSTGINPRSYPVTMPPPDVWQRLPDDDDGLADVAARYFGTDTALPLAGSQAAIRLLPSLLAPGTVAIADLTYGEYAPAFARAGHAVRRFAYRAAPDRTRGAQPGHATRSVDGTPSRDDTSPVFPLDADDPTALPADIDYLVVVNPNNPTTDRIAVATLLGWRAVLAARGGLLIVDEAFIDATPGASVAAACGAPGLLVLRSIGKFFGLAGLRAGFALGPRALLDRLRLELGPWSVNGPARHAACQALRDTAWRDETIARLAADSARLRQVLVARGMTARATSLFAWTPHPQAVALHARLARQGVWTRLFDPAASAGGHPSLRVGLPADAAATARLDEALRVALGG